MNQSSKTKRQFAIGGALVGVAIGATTVLAAVLRRKQREQVYHEAELKAMSELDDMMAETDNACAACDCMEDCAAQGCDCGCAEQMDIFDEQDRPAAAEQSADDETSVGEE